MKCTICKTKFKPIFSTLEKTCQDIDCKVKYSMQVVAKQKAKVLNDAKKDWEVKKRVLKDNLKTLGQYEAEAKKVFQKWVRMRDKDEPCISCGSVTAKEWHGSHFFSANLYSGLIFDERNVHKACDYCNVFLHGNLLEYRKGLIKRYGFEYVNQLEADSDLLRNYKYTKNELIAKRLQYEIKVKEL